jgi:hypothetical protein
MIQSVELITQFYIDLGNDSVGRTDNSVLPALPTESVPKSI